MFNLNEMEHTYIHILSFDIQLLMFIIFRCFNLLFIQYLSTFFSLYFDLIIYFFPHTNGVPQILSLVKILILKNAL